MRTLLIPVLSILLVGCGGTAPMPPPGMGSVTLGTSALDGSGFYPLEGDQTLVAGAQGGFHVWLKYRLSGMAPGKVHIKRTVRRISDGRLILTTEGAQDVGEPSPSPSGGEGYWELPQALPSFMCPTPIGVRVQDEPVHFDVVIMTDDQSMVLGEGTADATPRCPTGDEQSFCQQICDG